MAEKHRIYRTADWAVAGSIVGALAAYPFQHSFAGGLAFAGFSAAAIGGLADSFAVTAIFKDPLGWKWPGWMGTRIIPKNRDRLIRELSDMVQTDLLSVAAINGKLQQFNLAGWLLAYFDERDSSAELADFLHRIGADLFGLADSTELADHLEQWILDHADQLNVSEIAADIGQWSLNNGYVDRVAEFIVHEVEKWLSSPSFRAMLTALIGQVLDSYSSGSASRKMFQSVAGLSPEKLGEKAQDWLQKLAVSLRSPEHPYRIKLNEQLAAIIVRLREDDALRRWVEDGKMKLLESARTRIDLAGWLQRRMDEVRAAETKTASSWLRGFISQAVRAGRSNPETEQRLNGVLNRLVMDAVAKNHNVIGSMVRGGLSTFTDEKLTEFVHEKAGKDLQYIRINGTAVGFIIGLLLFAATFWIGR
ncbi:DUF445 domain-containing protein [Cohnella faecalis]|uniref:DUF445 domain-containing protein n=1 Tax=Cohnella faecalis TaxID=2315694 RepID=A0A398CN35_9BACL|nr:DUF445 domain-containing protein [Cohnella faecalis]RIE04023.1 DUF445 domain-containing protein [Cohnella faecalis]